MRDFATSIRQDPSAVGSGRPDDNTFLCIFGKLEALYQLKVPRCSSQTKLLVIVHSTSQNQKESSRNRGQVVASLSFARCSVQFRGLTLIEVCIRLLQLSHARCLTAKDDERHRSRFVAMLFFIHRHLALDFRFV